MRSKILMIIALFSVLASCTRYKNIVYLREGKNASDSSVTYPYLVPIYHIQNRDILYIQIISLNREVSELVNTVPLSTVNMYTNDASFYIYGYNVDDSGYVEIPLVGKVKVQGKTIEEAKDAIIFETLKIVKDPTVIVKLISFKISVIGEVNKPGSYQNYNNQLTILEAISQAGDISQYGNREKVLVIRPVNMETRTIRLDLTDKNILKSEGFYLLPNDIVYVEPVKSKNFRNNIPTYTLVLASITTFILVLNYFNNTRNK